MFRSIVLAFDGSAHARRALETACSLAQEMRASLGIICVVEPGHLNFPDDLRKMSEVEHIIDPKPRRLSGFKAATPGLATAVAQSAADAEQDAIKLAEYLVEDAVVQARRAGVETVDSIATTGDPAGAVVDYAETRDADLIVCGRRGLGSLKQLLLGSTSHKIAQLAGCSCLTVR